MAIIGNLIVYIIMACMVAGGIASILKPESELGNQFVEGISSIGGIFLSVAGIFASIPFLSVFIQLVFGKLFSLVGADPSMAATTIIAVDMGGYQLADALASTRESWIMSMYTGYMAGATIVFTIPIGLRMIQERDKKYFALGIMCGFLAVPFGVLFCSAITALSDPMIREACSSSGEFTYQLSLDFGLIFRNLIPLIIICVLIVVGLLVTPNKMIKGFSVFGAFIDIASRLVLILSILELFTGVFSSLFGSWGFESLMGSNEKSLEIVGSVCMMLAGAFPMVYLIQKYLGKGLGKLGKVLHLSENAMTGLLACCANTVAMFPMLKDMKAEDKVKVVAFSVCGAFLIGDHLSFMANFQPNLIVPLFIGKLLAGILSVVFAVFIAGPRARALEKADLAETEG